MCKKKKQKEKKNKKTNKQTNKPINKQTSKQNRCGQTNETIDISMGKRSRKERLQTWRQG